MKIRFEVVCLITALSVRIPEQKKGLRAFASRLRGDRVEVKTSSARGVTLRHIIYTSYSGELKLEKTFDAVGAQRSRILCSERLVFPRQSGYRRFFSTAFSSRLCTNFALEVLSACKNAAGLRVAIYDPAAYCADFLLSVLEHCSDVAVVTSCFEPYSCAARRALEELGAAAMITKNRSELSQRDLIIAPQRIAEELPLSADSVTLTASKPPEKTAGTLLYSYRFKMPNGFSLIKPKELSEEYFCSALYTIGEQYELGSIVPLTVCGVREEYDAKTLAKFLDKRI